VKKNYQRKERKSNHKFEVVRGQELLVRVPLPMAEVWAEMQAQVEELTGQAGLQILRAILENEVTRRVGPPHRPNPTAGCVRWGKQSGYVVFGGQKIPLERPRVSCSSMFRWVLARSCFSVMEICLAESGTYASGSMFLGRWAMVKAQPKKAVSQISVLPRAIIAGSLFFSTADALR
jgi:hypothetical protein